MQLHVVNGNKYIDPETESHYAYHRVIDSAQFPQVHDFYEIYLVTDGTLHLTMNDKNLDLSAGSLLWVRPGDVHTKEFPLPSEHINLAFSTKAVDSLFDYLYDKKTRDTMMTRSPCQPVILNETECTALRQKMGRLNLIQPDMKNRMRTQLRILLAEMVNTYLIDLFRKTEECSNEETKLLNQPFWFREALAELQNMPNLAEGSSFLRKHTGKTKEHLCRSFRKYLDTTPSDYINILRINYVADMLLHTNRAILDLAYEAGFENISYFYQKFKETFHLSPNKFREKNGTA